MQLITPRRAKVYILNGEDWIDNGTGYCTGEIDEKSNIPFFVVRNELDQSDIILKAYIEGNTQYQQQQETLIVWTDELGRDILLSFQEPTGCTSLCDFLIDVFQNYQPNISLVAVISNKGEGDITELIVGPVEFPPVPTMKNLNLVVECLNHGASSNYSKDQISQYVLENDYITKLIELFHRCETHKKLKNLHYLCDIMKILILYSNTQIIEVLLSDPIIMGVVGILEYDSEFPNYKSNHREYLSDESKFKEVIPINDLKVRNKIKSTFRLQFLKDVILAKLLDDSTFNLIQTLIYFNQVDVIKFLQESNGYMEKLFSLYDNTDDSEELMEKKRDCIRMLHQFAVIANTLQINQRSDFFKKISKGLFKMINFSLKDQSSNIKVLCTELIVSIIEHDAMLVNESYGKDENGVQTNDMELMTLLAGLLIEEKDIGLKLQALELIKELLDPSNVSNQKQHAASHFYEDIDDSDAIKFFDSSDAEVQQDQDYSVYIENFYVKVAAKLFGPLIELSKLEKIDHETVSSILDTNSTSDSILFQHLCELIRFCSTKHHKSLSRSFFLENNILVGLKNLVSNVFKTQLRLSAIRLIKSLIALDDEFYTRFIIVNDVLHYVVEFDLSLNTLATSTVLSIIEIDDINKETEERKKHYDLIMSYINKLIKFEEEVEVDDVVELKDENHTEEGKKVNSIDLALTNKLKREVSNSADGANKKVKWVKRLLKSNKSV